MPRVLIIAYGNPLRSDDGIAWRAVEELKREPGTTTAEIICVHQLMPELAEQVSHFENVVFVDASCEGELGTITCEPVSARSADVQFWHQLTAESLLALSAQLFGIAPRAFSVSFSGESFDHGDTLSRAATVGLPRLVARVSELVGHLADPSFAR
jgi:hydrogenase maturation protease